jgi:hypothetical protein
VRGRELSRPFLINANSFPKSGLEARKNSP